MGDLFEQFLKERRYLLNVTEKTLTFHKHCYTALGRSLGEETIADFPAAFIKATVNYVVIGLRESGIRTTSISCQARGINAFLIASRLIERVIVEPGESL